MEERLRRGEFEAVRGLLAALNYAAHAQDDLKDRVDSVTNGKARITVLVEGLRAFTDELLDTVPTGQCRQLRNTMLDLEIRMVPKRTPATQNVIMEKDLAKALVDKAMEKCRDCVEGPEAATGCDVYKILESLVPLDSYDNGLLCPYNMSTWKD